GPELAGGGTQQPARHGLCCRQFAFKMTAVLGETSRVIIGFRGLLQTFQELYRRPPCGAPCKSNRPCLYRRTSAKDHHPSHIPGIVGVGQWRWVPWHRLDSSSRPASLVPDIP